MLQKCLGMQISTEEKQWTFILPDHAICKQRFVENFLVCKDYKNYKFILCESDFLPRKIFAWWVILAFPAYWFFLGIFSLYNHFAAYFLKLSHAFLMSSKLICKLPNLIFPNCVLQSIFCHERSWPTSKCIKMWLGKFLK